MGNQPYTAIEQAIIEAGDNDFVEDLDLESKKLHYSKNFYVAMYKLLEEEKMSPIEAYESLGFDTKKLGKNRAYRAAKQARKLGKKKGYTIDPSSYDGSVPRDKMGEMTPEEELAYQQARIIYLEKFIEFQKKIPSLLEAIHTSSKKK